MSTTSILASRPLSDDSQPTNLGLDDVSGSKEKTSSGSESLLRFLDVASKTCVGVTTDLEPVHHLKTLGEGLSFSVKVHMRKQTGEHVLKVFKHSLAAGQETDFDEDRFKALMMEARVLGHRPIHEHENIVTMSEIALAVRSSNPFQISPALVLERAHHGTLASFQQALPKSQVDWLTRKSLCYDITAGLDALHQCSIVHGDLKADNVLVFKHPQRGYIAKLSDFGSAVILPLNVLPSTRMRLPAYTPPWNAPEATSYISPDMLPNTDLYSLGLLIWRILVHKDPFQQFDIALEASARLEHQLRILSVPNIAALVPCLIEKEIGFLSTLEIVMLTKLFVYTMNQDPTLRSVDQVLDLLSTSDCKSHPAGQSPVLRLLPLSDELEDIPSHLEWINRFHHLVQSQILLALEDFCGFRLVRYGKEPDKAKPEQQARLRESAIWTVFQCHLLGIGTKADARTAVDVLYYGGLPEYGGYWKSAVLIGPLYQALKLELPEERQTEVVALSVRALLVSGFSQTVLGGSKPRECQSLVNHAITMSKDAFSAVTARITGDDYGLACSILTSDDLNAGAGNTLLHVAAFFDEQHVVRYLIQHNLVDVNGKNEKGETALLIACRYNSYDVVSLLLSSGADASVPDHRGDTCLNFVSSFSEQSATNLAWRLHTSGAVLSWAWTDLDGMENLDLFGETFFWHGRVRGGPLMQAIAQNSLSAVQAILPLCLASQQDQATFLIHLFPLPLRLAAELHLYDIFEYLCLQALKVLEKMTNEDVPAEMVGTFIIRYTRSSSIQRSAIRRSSHVHRLAYHSENWQSAAKMMVKLLAKFGFLTKHISAHGSMERTLNFAIAAGNLPVVRELLEMPYFLAVIDEADEDHMVPPVHQALNSCKLDILKLLIEKGATVDLRKKRDPRHNLTGVCANYLQVIASLRIEDNAFAELILNNGVPPDLKDNRGLDAFGLCMTRCSFALGKLLLDRGYDLRTVGIHGVNVLGDRFVSNMAEQHDDILEAVKFLLNYEEDGSMFIVDHINQQTVLHIASAFPLSDRKRYKEILTVLLACFNKPEQLNFRAATQARSTPLQTAVASRNPIAVEALLAAGADVLIKDLGSQSSMDVARNSIVKLLAGDAMIEPADAVAEMNRSFETLALLAHGHAQPQDLQHNQQIRQALEAVKPLLDLMTRQSHQENYLQGLETEAFRLIAQHITEKPEKLDGVEDLRREVNSILEPCLFAELNACILPNKEWALNQRDSYNTVRRRISWTKTVDNARMSTLQQAAALEWMLDEIRSRLAQAAPDGKTDNWYGLSRFAKTADPAQLPYDHRFVRWPPSLLDCYVREIQENEIGEDLTVEERAEIASYVHILRARTAAQARGAWFDMPPFPEGFRQLHFSDLQPEPLEFDSLWLAPIMHFRCRCFREKISHLTVEFVEFNSQAIDTCWESRYFGNDVLQALHDAKERELERRSNEWKWKGEIGVLEGEGRVERTGLRRRDTGANFEEEMLRFLMQELGLDEHAVREEFARFKFARGHAEMDTDNAQERLEELEVAAQGLEMIDPEQSNDKMSLTLDEKLALRPETTPDDGKPELGCEAGILESIDSADLKFAQTKPDLLPDTVAKALYAYLFHAKTTETGAQMGREEIFAISHIRDVAQGKLKVEPEVSRQLEDAEVSAAGLVGPMEEHLQRRLSDSFPVAFATRRSTW